MNQKREVKIQAIENGIVIDHITPEHTMDVVKILNLTGEKILIGMNLFSEKMGKKGIIKLDDKKLADEELNKIALVSPKATITHIENFEVIKKLKVEVPDEFIGIARCPNPKCVTTLQPIKTHFYTMKKEPMMLKCKYCEKVFDKVSI